MMERRVASPFPEYHPFRSARARERYLTHYDAWAAEWPIPAESTTVSTSQGCTFVRIGGPATAPPLVLLPPTRASSLGWMLVIDSLSEYYRTYAVDNILDVGRSVNVRRLSARADAMGWLDELLDALGLNGPVNMMGASFGGWLTAEYAMHAPGRLAATVWLSPPSVVVAPSVAVLARMVLGVVPMRLTTEGLLRWLMPIAAHSDGRSGRFFDRVVEDSLLAGRCYRVLPLLGGGPRRFGDAELAGIKVPTLYVVGGHERLAAPDEVLARLKAVAPQITTVLVQDADHSLIISRPREVVREALRFLRGHAEEPPRPDAAPEGVDSAVE